MEPQRDNKAEPYAVVAMAGGAKRRSAWLGAAGLVVCLGLLVSVGAAGRLMTPPAIVPASAQPATEPPSVLPSLAFARTGVDPLSSSLRTMLPLVGYDVAYEADATHRPMLVDGGAVAIYHFGPLAGDGSFAGEIEVAVGTPAHGAAVLGHAGFATVFGSPLDALEAAYVATAPGRIVTREATQLDGVAATRLQLMGGPSGVAVALLAVHGNRAFVLTALGFGDLYPTGASGSFGGPARAGMDAFAAGFRFGTSLFVSRELGFQVPLPVGAEPTGEARHVALGQAQGRYAFPDGRRRDGAWSHSIGVSVGTRANPALVAALLTSGSQLDPATLWTPGLVDLQARYLLAMGGRVGSSALITLGGELALLIEDPGGVAAAVLAVHNGRVYIIATTGARERETAPHFEAFVAGFVFLD